MEGLRLLLGGEFRRLFRFLGSLVIRLDFLLDFPVPSRFKGVKSGRNLGGLVSLGLDGYFRPNFLTINGLKDCERRIRKLYGVVLLKGGHDSGDGHLTGGVLHFSSVHRHRLFPFWCWGFSFPFCKSIIAEFQRKVKLILCYFLTPRPYHSCPFDIFIIAEFPAHVNHFTYI